MHEKDSANAKKPKRILIFALTYHPFIGGAEIAVKEITDRIDPQEYEFDLLTLRFDSTLPAVEKIGNVTVHRLGFSTPKPSMADLKRFPLHANKYLFPFLARARAKKLHAERHYDAIWSIMANYAGFGALFFKMSMPTMPLVLTLQEGDPLQHVQKRVRFVYPFFKKIFHSAQNVQAISQYLATFARSMGYTGPLHVIPNGVDVSYFAQSYDRREIEELRKELGVHAGEKFIITTSRLVAKNAVDDVIRALSFLPQSIKFSIIGVGPDQLQLQGMVKDLNLEKRVMFIGHVDHRDIPEYLQAADVFVRPSLSEGMGNSFIEAMAAGIPVIATPVGGIIDFLFDPEKNPGKKPTGLFCAVRDPQSIATAVQQIFTDEKLRASIIINARDLVTASYDWDLIARRMRDEVLGEVTR